MKKVNFDEYRVTLFKKKLRAILGQMKGIRFGRSNGRCHLILDVSWRYFSNRDVVSKYVFNTLKHHGISFVPKTMRWNESETVDAGFPVDYFSIPIDQDALPERKRIWPKKIKSSLNARGVKRKRTDNRKATSAMRAGAEL